MIKIVGGPTPMTVNVFIVKDDEEEIDISGDVQHVTCHAHAADSLAEVMLGISFAIVDVTGELREILDIEVGKDENVT